MTTWLPFGYMCLHNIAAKYIDTGVTDAITKHDGYVASKTFTPSNITKWVSTVEHAWTGWRNTVTDPEHMASVDFADWQLLLLFLVEIIEIKERAPGQTPPIFQRVQNLGGLASQEGIGRPERVPQLDHPFPPARGARRRGGMVELADFQCMISVWLVVV
jgi:hypothetical protein